ncbi:hypothetical protein [Streptomyces fradiae]|uniref:hypothetical protein n=1 Tax=Streptomyces fradiae TaxID=1906 RepID=UPI0036ADBEEB
MTTGEPESRSRARRLIGVVLPIVLALGTAGGGLVYVQRTADEADRTVPTALWSRNLPKPGKDPAGDAAVRGRSSTPMSRLLLPVPEGYRLGPDIDGHGNDSEFGAKEATQRMKDLGRGLAGKDRRDFEKRVEKLGLGGMAQRSYLADSDELVLEVQVMPLKDRKHLRGFHEFDRGLVEWLDLKKGPKIKGHPEAVCHMFPPYIDLDADGAEEESGLDGMRCTAYTGDTSVVIAAVATDPLDKSEVADFVKQQLDHIASPGEYV